MKYFWGFLAAVIAVLVSLTVAPNKLGLGDAMLSFPLAQIISMRGVLALGIFLMALFVGIFAAIRYTMVNSGRIAGALAAYLLVISIAQGAIIYDRGISNPSQLGPDVGVSADSAGNGAVTVLTYNTLGGETAPADLVDVIVEDGVDVVVLPETSTAQGEELVALLAEKKINFQQFDTDTSQYDPDFESTVLLVSEGMGEYVRTDEDSDARGTVSAAPASGVGPHLIATHPIAPVPGLVEQWRSDIEVMYSLCDSQESFILAGDMNSTLDHQHVLGATCVDAAEQAGSAGLGSWPSHLPALLGSPIDRVLHDGGTYAGTDARLVTVGGSDHRGLVVRLTPVEGN